jgi:ribosomal protein L7Ae-like RNA K-turn-binding protein
MINNRFLSLLGFAHKSRNLVTGEDTCMINIKKGAVHLVFLAGDASDNTKDRFLHLCKSRNIPVRIIEDRDTLSSAIGKVNRTVFGVTDRKFAEEMLKALDA